MRLIFLFSVLLSLASCATAQPGASYKTSDKKAIKFYEQAQTCFRNVDPYTGKRDTDCAETNLKKALERDDRFLDAILLLSDVYIEQGKYKDAITAKERALGVAPNLPSSEYFYISTLAMDMGDYTKAKKFAELFLRQRNISDQMANIADRTVSNCNFAINALKNPQPYDPKNLGEKINTERPEYFPTLTADDKTLLFTRNVAVQGNPRVSGQEDFFVSTWNETGWTDGQGISRNINTSFNEGAPTFSADGKYVIFVGCEMGAKGSYNYGEGRQGLGSCDLFASERVGEIWSRPFNMGRPINTNNWESQPCFSSDGKSLYFIRGIIRNKQRRDPGEQDIYVTQITDAGTWSVPEKISNKVNTPFREESVQIHPDGQTLYFASDGHPGMGGLDIFVSRKDANGEWDTPTNLGYPINTFSHENSMLVSAQGKLAYFASNRDGGFGSLDLYSFNLPEKHQPIRTTHVKGKVYDAITKKPLAAYFQLIDLATGEPMKEAYANSGNGEFMVALPSNKNFALSVQHDGYLFYSKNYSMSELNLGDKEFEIEVPMNKNIIVLENVFFDVNSDKLKDESKYELNKIADYLTNNPTVKVELGGHTDSDGDDADNLDLSKRRAKSCLNYIVAKGIDAGRMTSKGYGETQPRVANDSAENKRLNRRTEMKIIE